MKRAFVLPFFVLLAACGGDDTTTPTPVNLPNVAGAYHGSWLVQFRRHRDDYSGSFYCNATITLAQSATGTLTGFAVVSNPCPPLSFDLAGSVRSDGSVTFVTGGPRPSVGQCPAAADASYLGVIKNRQMSMRASVELNCPGPGEGPHTFDYILEAWTAS